MCGCYYILFIWTHCYWPSARQHEELTTFFLCLLLWLKIGRGWKGDKREREVIQHDFHLTFDIRVSAKIAKKAKFFLVSSHLVS